MSLSDVHQEAEALSKRLADIQAHEIDWKREMIDNVLPLLSLLAKSSEEKFDEHDQAIEDLDDGLDMMVEGDRELLHPESAQTIAGTIAVGRLLVAELQTLVLNNPKASQAVRDRVGKSIKAFIVGAEAIDGILEAITVQDEDPDEDKTGGLEQVDPDELPDADDDANDEGVSP